MRMRQGFGHSAFFINGPASRKVTSRFQAFKRIIDEEIKSNRAGKAVGLVRRVGR